MDIKNLRTLEPNDTLAIGIGIEYRTAIWDFQKQLKVKETS